MPSLSLEDFHAKFWSLVAAGPTDECWLWSASRTSNGYGQISHQKRPYYAHRLAWMLTNGPIPNGLFVCHRCDVPHCCNPAHLFLGTNLDNIKDCVAKGRKKRHPAAIDKIRGERSWLAKLTDADVMVIRQRWKSGETQRLLAREHNVCKGTIGHIVHGRTWTHLP